MKKDTSDKKGSYVREGFSLGVPQARNDLIKYLCDFIMT